MRKLKSIFLLGLLATLSVAQNPVDFISPEIKRVGMKLACLCGSCRNTVGDCAMIGCSYAFPARQKIKRLQTMGSSDSNVIAKFMKDDGLKVLAEPQTSGFGLLGWLMPGLATALGLMAILFYWKRFRNPVAVAAPIALDEETSARYAARAKEELEKLEK
ncbi:MAG: cytochrome c-type biogenesis protein CcmH [Bryobacter sp.]|nr:cytochrome c-type biogenesis protein CcmH [Bryobacter sp.]